MSKSAFSTRYRLRLIAPAWVGKDGASTHGTSYLHSDDYGYLHEQALRAQTRGGRAQFERLDGEAYRAF